MYNNNNWDDRQILFVYLEYRGLKVNLQRFQLGDRL